MRITRLVLGALETNCWVVGDDAGGPVAVIDPAAEAQEILEACDGRSLCLIVLTHGHFDHLGAVTELIAASGADFAVHELDAPNVTSAHGTGGLQFGFDVWAPCPTRTLRTGEVFSAGGVRFRVLHTPGHTPGGICLLAADGSGFDHLFSGDTLFAGSVGRTDFPGGDSRALARSIAQVLAPLDSSTIVHPGHGPDTTIARESRINPFWPRG
jgi:hydroxyacylglutathione hydrolase